MTVPYAFYAFLDWLIFCLFVELVVACFTGAAVVHDSHRFDGRTMGVAALITAGILLAVTGVVVTVEAGKKQEASDD